MSGQWIKRKANEHQCRKPDIDSEARDGDEWRCNECRGVWQITSDQRDGHYWRGGKPVRYDRFGASESPSGLSQRAQNDLELSRQDHIGPYGYGPSQYDR